MTSKDVTKIANVTADILRPLFMKENSTVVDAVERYMKRVQDMEKEVSAMRRKLAMDPKCPTCGRKH